MSVDYANIHASGFDSEGSYTPDKLFDRDTMTLKVTVVSGAGVLARGALLGKITTGGKYKLSTSGASDGSQTPTAILVHPVDATSADVEAIVFIKGRFNSGAMTFGASHTAASVYDGLRDLGIYLETIVG